MPVHGQRGVTLVELMIAVALAGILSSGLFYLITNQQKSYTEQFQQMTVQANTWGALQYLQREIQRAGYGFAGCPNGRVKKWSGAGATVVDSSIVAFATFNNFNLLTNAADTQNSDSFTVTYNNDPALGTLPGATLKQDMLTTDPASAAGKILVSNTNSFPNGTNAADFVDEYVLLWQRSSSTQECLLLKATGTVDGGAGREEILHASDSSYNTSADLLDATIINGDGYDETAAIAVHFGPASAPRHFAIDRRVNPPRLVTWSTYATTPSSDLSNIEVVADGIEDMQITTACDANNDNVLAEGKVTFNPDGSKNEGNQTNVIQDEWANNAPSDVAFDCGDNPISLVRVTLVGRSASAVIGNKKGFLPAVEDRAAGTPSDDLSSAGGLGTYARSTMTTTAILMNTR